MCGKKEKIHILIVPIKLMLKSESTILQKVNIFEDKVLKLKKISEVMKVKSNSI